MTFPFMKTINLIYQFLYKKTAKLNNKYNSINYYILEIKISKKNNFKKQIYKKKFLT